jgi:hypothetical protein
MPRLVRSAVLARTRSLRAEAEEWIPSPRGEEVLERTPSLREGTPERMLELRGVSLRLEFLKLLLRSDELRLELLNELRLEELLELLRLELLLNELWPPPLLRLLLIDELLWLPPPPRLPPPRCASAGVALSARPIITKVIHFEVFISLLLSCLFSVLFSIAKIDKKAGEISPAFNYFSKRLSDGASFGDLLRGCNQH